MRVLIACEFSGIVRDAFLERGHDAVSCDVLPTERPGPHLQADIRAVLAQTIIPWDLMIAHPPCTYLANSGVRWLYGGKGTTVDRTRWIAMEEAAVFFANLLTAPIRRVAVENPIMHKYAKGQIRFHAGGPAIDDVEITSVQPWQFGTPETKATQLWLRNLPPLVPTNVVDGRTPRVHFASPGPNRWKERSRTDPNIAAAMAEQWGNL